MITFEQSCIGAGNILFKLITEYVPTFMKSFVSDNRLCFSLKDDNGAKYEKPFILRIIPIYFLENF